jgi:hypothetical protein
VLKKLFTILLIAVFAFANFGYNLYKTVVQYQANKHAVAQINNGTYQNNNVVEVVLPLDLPYANNQQSSYTRYEGSFEHAGIVYHYIEKKISNGKVYLKCLQDASVITATENAKPFFETPAKHNTPDKTSKQKYNMAEFTLPQFVFTATPTSLQAKATTRVFSKKIHPIYLPVFAPPPQVA